MYLMHKDSIALSSLPPLLSIDVYSAMCVYTMNVANNFIPNHASLIGLQSYFGESIEIPKTNIYSRYYY